MALTREMASAPRLAEGDPLPPDHDRPASAQHALSIGALYRDHGARLRRFFARRAPSGEADDLVQETFARLAGAAARRGNEGDIEQPRAYVNRIADNLLREQARFAARRSAAFHIQDEEVPLAAADPIAHLEARDMIQRLEKAMARMKPATREIFMDHRLEGFTYREIATRRGVSVKVVEKHLGKAIFLVNRALRGG